jgi:Uma2 family endonuclease
VIEVLSVGNTYGEMTRKRREYFQAGVQLLWIVDPRERNVTIYRNVNDPITVREGTILDGEHVLPGWKVDTGELFGKLEERK